MFKCECGKEFENGQSFNGHKSRCKIHLEIKYGTLDFYNEQRKIVGDKVSNTVQEKNKRLAKEKLDQWISEQHTCERCGKVMTEYYGSGRFCCQSCANSKQHSEETKKKISEGLKKETICYCQYCGKEFKALNSKASHECKCTKNPNKSEVVNKGSITNHINSLSNKVSVIDYKTRKSVQLDITKGELEKYREEHPCCEICGKSVDNLSAPGAKKKTYQLSIDHIHSDNTFRGLLCMTCNSALGWYEKNKSAIEAYLNKDKNQC